MADANKETRVLDLNTSKLAVEKRADGTTKISGYAAVFNSDSEDMGFIESIKPGAFKSALRKSDVRALFNHDPNLIFGRTGVNLRIKEDDVGLHMEVSPLSTSTYKMVEENVSAGLVTQQSFAFTVVEDEWNDDFTKRTINKVGQIFDVSPVTYPAYADTSVALRCRQEAIEKRDGREYIEIVDGESVFRFSDMEQIERVVEQITELFDEDADESPMADTVAPESRSDSGGSPTSNEPQTAEELEARYKTLIDKKRGF